MKSLVLLLTLVVCLLTVTMVRVSLTPTRMESAPAVDINVEALHQEASNALSRLKH